MSSYSNYLKYKNSCCVPGPQGPIGLRGPTGINGSAVNTGATGPASSPGVVINYVYKNSGFSDNLKLTRSSSTPFNPLLVTGYSCSSEGYTLSIKPTSTSSCIKVQFKIKYRTSDIVGTRLDIGVVYTTDGGTIYSLLGQDTFCGTNNASYPLINTYTLNYMHCPSTTNTVTYTMFFNLESTANNSLGILGNNPGSTSNCIILEEYAGVGNPNNGPTGPIGPVGPVGPTGAGSGGVPTGAIMLFGTSIVPTGWLACDGSNVLISSYTNLYLTIGCTYGCGAPAGYFTLPDLRGYFVRGWNSGATGAGGIDSGRAFASVQQDQIQPHQHISSNNDCQNYAAVNGVGTGIYNAWCDTNGIGSGPGAALTDDGTYPEQLATGVVGIETRPINIALLYCIKT
jgi:microcystin-dependent protein